MTHRRSPSRGPCGCFMWNKLDFYKVPYSVFLLLLLCSYYCYSCPTACSCEYPGIVYCAGMQLRNIPDVPRNTKTLILGSNFIHFVSLDSFLEVRLLTELHLDRNLIGIIPSKAFNPLVNLKFLDLRHNRIRSISRLAFSGLVSLNSLNLAGNHITTVDVGALTFAPELETLNFYGNPIRQLPDGLFRSSARMKSLNLGKCDIQTLTNKTFRGLGNLSSLILGENKNLDALRDDSFLGLSMLEKLTINQGGLKRISPGAFGGLRGLKELLLDHNRLAHTLPLTTFEDTPSIEVLRLDGNRLSSLHYNVVSSLKNLRKLQLDDNRWRCDCGLLGVRAYWPSSKPSLLTSPGIRCTNPEKNRDLSLWNIPVRSLLDSCLRNIEATTISVSVNIGSRVDIECALSARNDSYLAWFSSNTVYIPDAIGRSNNSRFVIQENGALSIDPVTDADLGPFICSVTYSDGSTGMRAVALVSGEEEVIPTEKTSRLMTYVIVIVTFVILCLLIMLLLLVVVIQRKNDKDERRRLSYNPFTFWTMRPQNNEAEYSYAYAEAPRHQSKPFEIDAYAISGNLAEEKFKQEMKSLREVDNKSPNYCSFLPEEHIPPVEQGETKSGEGLGQNMSPDNYAYVSPNEIQLEKMRKQEQEGHKSADEEHAEEVDVHENRAKEDEPAPESRESTGYIEVID